jgi:lambda family phage portal protein
MKFLRNILFKIPAVRDAAKNAAIRAYAAAAQGRLQSSWRVSTGSINRDIKAGTRPVRDRARDLWRNNDYVRAYRTRNRVNIVGAEGFKHQNKALLPNGEEDIAANKIIEDAWKEYCKAEFCTMSKQLTARQVQWLQVDQLKRDGEILARMRKVNDLSKNKFGFALELLETDLLDETYNVTELSNGNTVIMGIELNEWRQPVAYYFKDNQVKNELSTNYYGAGTRERNRVPAEEILFAFDPEHANQFRGISHLAQSMLTFHNLERYDNSALTAAEVGASKVGFFEVDKELMDEYGGDDEDENGNTISNMSPGEFEQLPPGMKFNGWDPTYPHEQYPSFVKQILRRLAAGLALAYNSWIGDLEGVNFSSMRHGNQDEKESWMIQQALYIDAILIPWRSAWLKRALFVGAVKLNYADYERLNQPVFMGRRWNYFDPAKDVDASINAIDNFLSTHTDELAKTGKDFADIITTQKKELEMMQEIVEMKKKLGLIKEKTKEKPAKDSDEKEEDEEQSQKQLKKVI